MLAYQRYGSGPAVVLVHGFPLSGAIWGSQARALSDRYQVILPDLPGLGDSAPVPEITVAQMASELLRLLDELGITRAAVAGHSMGGYVTLALLQQAPERLSGLGLICTQAGSDSPEARDGRYATARKVESEGAQVMVDAMLPKLFATPEPDRAVAEAVAGMIRQTPVAGIKGALHAMAGREDLQALLPAVSVPALVLTGADDRLIPPARSEAMAAQIPRAILDKVDGAGHMPMMEQPDAVNAALGRWLSLVTA